MSGDHGWQTPGQGQPPGWSPQQPPPYGQGGWSAPGAPGQPPGPGQPPPGQPPGGQPSGPYGAPPAWATAPKPGVIELRPLGLGEMLDGAFNVIRRNPAATLGLSAIVMGITTVLNSLVGVMLLGEAQRMSQLDPEAVEMTDIASMLGRVFTGVAITLVVTLFATLVLTGMLTVVVGRATLGYKISMGDAWRAALPRIGTLLGVSLLVFAGSFAFFIAVIAIFGGLMYAAGPDSGTAAFVGILSIFLFPAAFVVMIWLYVGWALSTPAVVLERQGVIAAMKRSFRLVKGSWWRTFGILLLTAILAGLISGILPLPFQGIASIFADPNEPSATGAYIASIVITTIGSGIAATIATPFQAGVTVLLYVDQRIRKEGLDLALRTAAGEGRMLQGEEFAMVWTPPEPGATPPTPPPGYGTPPGGQPGPYGGPPPGGGQPGQYGGQGDPYGGQGGQPPYGGQGGQPPYGQGGGQGGQPPYGQGGQPPYGSSGRDPYGPGPQGPQGPQGPPGW
ncbi:MAG: hypothetical protein GEV11_15405 [Streptosporangiales bacterium]|nr:hypothetical protein [Streptosporangiales bacterium]